MIKITDSLQMSTYQDADRIGFSELLKPLRLLKNVLSRSNKEVDIKKRKI